MKLEISRIVDLSQHINESTRTKLLEHTRSQMFAEIGKMIQRPMAFSVIFKILPLTEEELADLKLQRPTFDPERDYIKRYTITIYTVQELNINA